MNTADREPVLGLSPEAVELVETYFARVHGALLVAAAGECEETVQDLRTHVYEELAGTPGSAADVTRVLAELGPPEALAAHCADVASDEASLSPWSGDERSALSGTLLGVPYELRVPTAERVASRWWNPLDPHVIVPRLFGLGWTVNFGAVAVRLGWVRPDDEDVPFESVPERYLAIALVLPLLIGAGLALLVAVYQGGLPAQVAIHWGIGGAPDDFASKESALVMPVVMTSFGLAIACAAWLRRRPPLARVAAGALATMLCSISAAAYAQQVATAYGATDVGILLPGMALGLVLTFGMLLALSRIGHHAEVSRDLAKESKKGSV
jgi:hypothetical protein